MLTGIIALLLLLLALLAVPISLSYQITWHQTAQGSINLVWLFGLVHLSVPLSQTESPHPETGKHQKRIHGVKPSRKKKTNVFALIRQKSFRRRIFRFIRDLWRALHKRDIVLRMRIGLGDPADTGMLWAIVGPVSGILANTREAVIDLEPDFFDATFELDSSGHIRIIPLQLLTLTLGLILSPSVRQGIKRARTG